MVKPGVSPQSAIFGRRTCSADEPDRTPLQKRAGAVRAQGALPAAAHIVHNIGTFLTTAAHVLSSFFASI